MIKNKKKVNKKKATTKAKVTKAKGKPVKRNKKRANEYDSWTGAASTSGRELFDTETREIQDLRDFPEVAQYLPPNSDEARDHFFVARVATVSKKPGKKEVVKLFVNRSWNDSFVRQVEGMDFTKVGRNRDRLVSDVKLQIDIGEEWKIDSYIEIFRDLDPPGRPTAKVVFTNKRLNRLFSGFWCW